MFGGSTSCRTDEARRRADQLLEQFELTDAANRVVKTYSGGMRRRLDLGSALIGRPRLLFLDEPTTGLDPRSRLGMWDVIRGLVSEGTTLLLTTQYLEEADELADAIAVVDHGKIIARGTADELKSSVGGDAWRSSSTSAPTWSAAPRSSSRAGQRRMHVVEDEESRIPAARAGASVAVQVVRDLDDAGIAIDDIGLRRPTLDDVFLALTGHAAEDERQPTASSEPPRRSA